ncbi:MAG: hypothetical protein U1E29_11830 [Coriobacteriia bacterium]|nr:hypothetical protein [Coriobacteriia bacterium]
MGSCALCGVEGPATPVRIYYANRTAQSRQAARGGTMVTTRYAVGGWDAVPVCDACVRHRSRVVGIANALWSIPLTVATIVLIVASSLDLESDLGGPGVGLQVVVLLAIPVVAYVSILRIVKPLNEASRTKVAKKMVKRARAGAYDTFWTEREYANLMHA